MKRYALLIEAGSYVENCENIPGPAADMSHYQKWLKSNEGGAWNDDEIHTIISPVMAYEIDSHVKAAGECEYAFVAFSGHGHHVRYSMSGEEETRVLICGGELPVSKLVPSCLRTTIVVDACRELSVIRLSESFTRARPFQYQKKAFVQNARMQHRAFFDDLVKNAAAGDIFLYSCSVNELAGDSAAGGVFTFGLLDKANVWAADQDETSYLPINKAFHLASDYTTSLRRVQHPHYHADRRINHFPFAVVVR